MGYYRVEYSSNNSGGSWWLSDSDWKALEDAGWDVDWFKDDDYHSGDRFLDGLASRASKTLEAPSEGLAENWAIAEWEEITGEYSEDSGCSCCGPPHYFYTDAVDEPEKSDEELLADFDAAVRALYDDGFSDIQLTTRVENIFYREDV